MPQILAPDAEKILSASFKAPRLTGKNAVKLQDTCLIESTAIQEFKKQWNEYDNSKNVDKLNTAMLYLFANLEDVYLGYNMKAYDVLLNIMKTFKKEIELQFSQQTDPIKQKTLLFCSLYSKRSLELYDSIYDANEKEQEDLQNAKASRNRNQHYVVVGGVIIGAIIAGNIFVRFTCPPAALVIDMASFYYVGYGATSVATGAVVGGGAAFFAAKVLIPDLKMLEEMQKIRARLLQFARAEQQKLEVKEEETHISSPNLGSNYGTW